MVRKQATIFTQNQPFSLTNYNIYQLYCKRYQLYMLLFAEGCRGSERRGKEAREAKETHGLD